MLIRIQVEILHLLEPPVKIVNSEKRHNELHKRKTLEVDS